MHWSIKKHEIKNVELCYTKKEIEIYCYEYSTYITFFKSLYHIIPSLYISIDINYHLDSWNTYIIFRNDHSIKEAKLILHWHALVHDKIKERMESSNQLRMASRKMDDYGRLSMTLRKMDDYGGLSCSTNIIRLLHI